VVEVVEQVVLQQLLDPEEPEVVELAEKALLVGQEVLLTPVEAVVEEPVLVEEQVEQVDQVSL
tara:strand:+ start:842 stop:1030 length:189 start_codon:yes stop_codon:yes gene_type:complete